MLRIMGRHVGSRSPIRVGQMTQPRRRSEETGTALAQVRPWLRATDALVASVRQWLDGTGSEAEMERCLHNYYETARDFLGEPDEPEPPDSRGPAYKGLSELRYLG